MNKRINFILRSVLFLIGFALLCVFSLRFAHFMVDRGFNTIVAALPLALLFFGLGVLYVE